MGAKLFLKNSTGQSLKNSSGQFIYKSLPAAYQEVEYIGFSGTQYIDTLVNGNNVNLEINIIYEPASPSQQAIFSARTSSSSGISYWTDGYCHFGNSSTQVAGVSTSGRHQVTLSKNGLWYDGTKLNFTAGTTMANANLLIGRVAGDNRTFSGKVYHNKVATSGSIIRYFVPCYRKSDSVIGMYDLVNNQFYINAGSGTFTKGSNVD